VVEGEAALRGMGFVFFRMLSLQTIPLERVIKLELRLACRGLRRTQEIYDMRFTTPPRQEGFAGQVDAIRGKAA
jgi:hypothetical protein